MKKKLLLEIAICCALFICSCKHDEPKTDNNSNMEVVGIESQSIISEEITIESEKQSNIAINKDDSLNRRYCVVIGSFRDSINAQRLLDKMKKKSYEPEIRDTVFNLIDTMHRVVIASFDNFEDANAFIESNENTLKDKYRHSNIWIRNPVLQDDKNIVPSKLSTDDTFLSETKPDTSFWDAINNWMKNNWMPILIGVLILLVITGLIMMLLHSILKRFTLSYWIKRWIKRWVRLWMKRWMKQWLKDKFRYKTRNTNNQLEQKQHKCENIDNHDTNEIYFCPSVGDKYNEGIRYSKEGKIEYGRGLKVIVLGESHYPEKETDILQRSQTIEVIESHKNRVKNGRSRAFNKFEESLCGEKLSMGEDCKIFWNHLIFYNYLQKQISAPRVAPDEYLFKDAVTPFKEVLKEHEPDIVIVWGKRLFKNLKKYFGGQIETIQIENKTIEILIYYLSDGKKIIMHHIKHPSWPFFKAISENKIIVNLFKSI
jgi:hypothetical protein